VIWKADVSHALKRLRGGRTRALCAREAGISANAWTHYEQGRRMPTGKTLLKLATGLGVTLPKLEEEFLHSRNQRLREEADRAKALPPAQPLTDDPYDRAIDEGLDIIKSELRKLLLLRPDPKRSRG
jgi:transcriptional regulator with XRE-family HTH domain